MLQALVYIFRVLSLALFVVLMLLMADIYEQDRQISAAERQANAKKIETLYVALTGRHGI